MQGESNIGHIQQLCFLFDEQDSVDCDSGIRVRDIVVRCEMFN